VPLQYSFKKFPVPQYDIPRRLLSLALLVLRILADHAHAAFAADDLAVLT